MGGSFFFPLYQARKYVLTSWYCNSFVLSHGVLFFISVLGHYPRWCTCGIIKLQQFKKKLHLPGVVYGAALSSALLGACYSVRTPQAPHRAPLVTCVLAKPYLSTEHTVRCMVLSYFAIYLKFMHAPRTLKKNSVFEKYSEMHVEPLIILVTLQFKPILHVFL